MQVILKRPIHTKNGNYSAGKWVEIHVNDVSIIEPYRDFQKESYTPKG